MKKLILILAILLGSLSLFSQQTTFALATKYQSKSPSSEWGEWQKPSDPILIYMDLGFGFIAIENGYHDRFIVSKETTAKTYDSPEKTIFTVRAIDQSGKNCTLEFCYFATGNFAIIIIYNDIHYSYWCDGEHGAEGYPYQYFNSQPPQPTPSPKVKDPGSLAI